LQFVDLVDMTVIIIFSMNYGASQKKSPLQFYDIFSPNGWEFLINFYTPTIRSYLR